MYHGGACSRPRRRTERPTKMTSDSELDYLEETTKDCMQCECHIRLSKYYTTGEVSKYTRSRRPDHPTRSRIDITQQTKQRSFDFSLVFNLAHNLFIPLL